MWCTSRRNPRGDSRSSLHPQERAYVRFRGIGQAAREMTRSAFIRPSERLAGPAQGRRCHGRSGPGRTHAGRGVDGVPHGLGTRRPRRRHPQDLLRPLRLRRGRGPRHRPPTLCRDRRRGRRRTAALPAHGSRPTRACRRINSRQESSSRSSATRLRSSGTSVPAVCHTSASSTVA